VEAEDGGRDGQKEEEEEKERGNHAGVSNNMWKKFNCPTCAVNRKTEPHMLWFPPWFHGAISPLLTDPRVSLHPHRSRSVLMSPRFHHVDAGVGIRSASGVYMISKFLARLLGGGRREGAFEFRRAYRMA